MSNLNAKFDEFKAQHAVSQCETSMGIGLQNAMAGEELLVHRLIRHKNDNLNSAARFDRIIDILNRHPEFQEFLEVLRSGLV